MTWLHPTILAGLGLVAVPVLLHLLMRQKPKKLVFPALRLIQERRKQNSRRFRLRHWWLLFLRMAALAAIVAAVARPTLPAANYNLSASETTTLGIVIALGVAAYYGTLARWRKRELPPHEMNLKRAQLRGWITGATVLLALLAAGWPYQKRVRAEITSPLPTTDFELPVAAVFVFDCSLSMQYTQEGKTRLDVAKVLATEHLRDFPSGSRVAIAESSNDNPLIYQASLSAAQSRIDAAVLSPAGMTLNDRLRAAVNLQADDRVKTVAEAGSTLEAGGKDRFIRRIYVFTDLAATAWRDGQSKMLQQDFERVPGLALQIVDVGEINPRNTSVQNLKLSRQRVPVGGTLIVSADVMTTGESGDRKADLSLQSPTGSLVLREAKTISNLGPGTAQRVDYNMLTDLTGPVVHGEVRLASSDPLPFDDVAFFTATVGKAPKVLVVSPRDKDSNELMVALDPFSGRGGELKFDPVPARPRDLATAPLSDYDVIYLVDVPALADDVWTKLGTYVEQGGGLAVVLGSEIDPLSYGRASAMQFLPAQPDVYHGLGDFRINFDKREHPLFWRFRQYTDYGSFAAMENDVAIYRFYQVAPAAGATVLATYTDPQRWPCLIDRPHGRGRTVMFTTAMHLPDDPDNRWNTFASPQAAPWLLIAFCEQLTEYLARTTELQFNITAGEPVTLPITPAPAAREFLLRRPALAQSRQTAPAEAATIVVDATKDVGQYDLVAVGQDAPITGFSANASPGESDLTRMAPERLDELFGKDKYHVARTLNEIKADVNISDLGKEVFPLVLLLAILAFLGEHLVANWFYEVDSGPAGMAARGPSPNGASKPSPSTKPVRESVASPGR